MLPVPLPLPPLLRYLLLLAPPLLALPLLPLLLLLQ